MDDALVSVSVTAKALRLDEPLSFWGGLDPETGVIIDRLHPQCGAVVTATVLVMPSGRGSSSASSVLTEAVRLGTAPAALVLSEPDEILVLGALVADELYGIHIPVLVCPEATTAHISTNDHLHIVDGQLIL